MLSGLLLVSSLRSQEVKIEGEGDPCREQDKATWRIRVYVLPLQRRGKKDEEAGLWYLRPASFHCGLLLIASQ
jgi:hypothetical protein